MACSPAPLETPDAGPDAGVDAGLPLLDPAVAQEILAAHNAIRASAMPTPMPALTPMTWHEGAAAAAAAWVARCQYDHNPSLGSTYGENIFAGSGTYSATEVVDSWASERTDYDYATNRCSGDACGHYTQLVWRTSVGLGCAYQRCTTGSPFTPPEAWDFWVCDYAPAGNFVGQRPY